jgi:L-threonylcarbamoyladenylate synthase
VPGDQRVHYAPLSPLAIVASDEIDSRAEALSAGGHRIAVLAQRLPMHTYRFVTWINAGRRPDAYAHDLYANLRTLDTAGCAQILVQDVPADERWAAIRDRLARAAAGSVDPASISGEYRILP